MRKFEGKLVWIKYESPEFTGKDSEGTGNSKRVEKRKRDNRYGREILRKEEAGAIRR